MTTSDHRWRPLRSLPLAAALAVALTACGGTADPASDGSGGTLQVAVAFSPKAGYAVDSDDAFILTQGGVLETLTTAGTDAVPQPRLATSWARASELAWDFTLRDGVRFQDGTAFDAGSVVTAVEHVTGVDAVPRALAGLGLTATASGPRTVRLTTTTPDPVLPLRMSSPNTGILAPSAYTASPPTVVGTGTGPFELTATNGTATATFVRNDDYWGTPAALDSAEFRFVPDPASRLSAVQAGDVQVAQGVPPNALPDIEASGGELTAQQYVAPRTTSLYTNLQDPALADVRVRQALAAALDRPALVASVLEGTGEAAVEQFGSAVAFGRAEDPPGADPAAARDLLAAAGYGDASPLTLRLWTYSNRPELPDLATAVQTMLADAGVRTEITVAEYASLEPDLLAGDFDLFILSRSYLTDFPDAGGFLASDYGCDGSYNLNRWCSPEFDALLTRLRATDDAAARVALFRQAAATLADQVIGVPLLHTGAITAVASSVDGFTADPLDQTLLTSTVSLRS